MCLSGSPFRASKDMEKPDAGLRSLDHCASREARPSERCNMLTLWTDKTRLPSWRYRPRQWLIPLVRWETPHLAALQASMRRPTLDSYFAITANLGTHTFFMIVLPILFWCGYTSLGRGYGRQSALAGVKLTDDTAWYIFWLLESFSVAS